MTITSQTSLIMLVGFWIPAAVARADSYVPWDELTEASWVDANDDRRKPVSTFAVTVPGDVNKDLRVDLADLALLAENWMVGVK